MVSHDTKALKDSNDTLTFMISYIDHFFGLKRQQQKNQWVSSVLTANAQTEPHARAGGKPLAWDVTIVNIRTESYIRNTASLAGEATKHGSSKEDYQIHQLRCNIVYSFQLPLKWQGRKTNYPLNSFSRSRQKNVHRYKGTA